VADTWDERSALQAEPASCALRPAGNRAIAAANADGSSM